MLQSGSCGRAIFGRVIREAFSEKECPGINLNIEAIGVARAGRRALHTEGPAYAKALGQGKILDMQSREKRSIWMEARGKEGLQLGWSSK